MHVVVNARTDLFLRQDGDESDRVERAIARLTEAAAAGADVLYPVGFHDPETLRRLASELPLPINAIAQPDQSDPASFGPLGVGRISFGPFLQGALSGRAKELLSALGIGFRLWRSDDEPDWHDQRPVVMTAGVAALILVALLVYAVIRTSDSSKVPDTVPIPSSSATPSTYTTSSTSTTSYSVPRVQTSEDNPGAPGSPPSGPPARSPTPRMPSDEPSTSDRYTTTTSSSAGHI